VGPLFQRSEDDPPDIGREQPGENSSARAPGGSSGSELKRVVDAAARRVDEIVDGAEQLASEIIADAESEATQYLDGRRQEVEELIDEWTTDLRGLAELLSRQEGRLRELTESMIGELEEIGGVLRRIPPEIDRWRERSPGSRPDAAGPERPATPAGRERPEQRVEEQPREPAADAPEPERGERPASHGHENALLRAAQMAVAGSSRDEIEHALTAELAVRDPRPIVDELLGPRR
jgi:hypothetical protein